MSGPSLVEDIFLAALEKGTSEERHRLSDRGLQGRLRLAPPG